MENLNLKKWMEKEKGQVWHVYGCDLLAWDFNA